MPTQQSIDIVIRLREMFFDRQAVIDAVGRANAKVLSKAGAFIQRRAKSSIRKRKRVSDAGRTAQQPRRHAAEPDLLQLRSAHAGRSSWGRRPWARSAWCRRCSNTAGRPRGGRIPAAASGRWAAPAKSAWTGRLSRTTKKNRDGKLVTYARLQTTAQVDRANRLNEELYGPEFVGGNRIEARPYMGPALQKEMPNLPALWANSVRIRRMNKCRNA